MAARERIPGIPAAVIADDARARSPAAFQLRGGNLDARSILALQRSAGNAAVCRAVMARSPLASTTKDFDVTIPDRSLAEQEAGPVKGSLKLGGTVSFKAKDAADAAPAEGGAEKPAEGVGPKPMEAKGSVGKDDKGNATAKAEATSEFELGWHSKFKVGDEIGVSKDGIKFNFSLGLEHEGFKLGSLVYGPQELKFTGLEWESGKVPKVATFELRNTVAASTPGVWQRLGTKYEVSPKLSIALSLEPNWKELARKLVQTAAEGPLASGLAAAGAIAGPLVVGAVLAVGWAKSGHEMDEWYELVVRARATSKAAANLASGEPLEHAMTGTELLSIIRAGELSAVKEKIVPAIRAKVEAETSIPPGLLAAMAAKPGSGVRDKLYVAAWTTAWPPVKKAGLDAFKDDRVLTMTVEAFETGEFSKGV